MMERYVAILGDLDLIGGDPTSDVAAVVDEAVSIIEPYEALIGSCKSTVRTVIALCNHMKRYQRLIRPSEERENLVAFAKAENRAASRAMKLSEYEAYYLFGSNQARDEFCNQAQKRARRAMDRARNVNVISNKRTRRLDPVVLEAARSAYHLIWFYSREKQPTQTIEGAYYQLTAVLVEAVTGRRDASVDRSCKRILELPEGQRHPFAPQLDHYQRAASN
jgi:hypothetical protein